MLKMSSIDIKNIIRSFYSKWLPLGSWGEIVKEQPNFEALINTYLST